MSNIVNFKDSKQCAYEVLDKLRKDIESGKVVGFIAVAVSDDDTTSRYQAFTKKTTRLRAVGMVSCLHNAILNEDNHE